MPSTRTANRSWVPWELKYIIAGMFIALNAICAVAIRFTIRLLSKHGTALKAAVGFALLAAMAHVAGSRARKLELTFRYLMCGFITWFLIWPSDVSLQAEATPSVTATPLLQEPLPLSPPPPP